MIWIVSPLYRDVDSYERVVEEVSAAVIESGDMRLVRFLVVDDSAGTDPDVGRLAGLDDVEVLTPARNLGHQAAIVHALRRLGSRIADDDVVVTMDSDGEDRPADAPRLLGALRAPGVDMVLARRTTRTETRAFKAGYFCFRLCFRALTGTTVRSGNFAAMTGATLKAMIGGADFDVVYSAALLAADVPTALVPCPRGRRFAGRSHMHGRALVRHGVRMLHPFRVRARERMLTVSRWSARATWIIVWAGILEVVPESAATWAALVTVHVALAFSAAELSWAKRRPATSANAAASEDPKDPKRYKGSKAVQDPVESCDRWPISAHPAGH